MSLTPETLTRHELNGLPVRVAAAGNPDLVGIAGRVVGETMQTLRVDCDADLPQPVDFEDEARSASNASGRRPRACTGVKQVPKQGTTFEFAIPTERDGEGPSPSPRTDEAAAVRKAAGSTSELGSETAGVRPGQSGPFASAQDATSQRDECEGVVYVTVDGVTLLSRPATRTERAGDSTWH